MVLQGLPETVVNDGRPFLRAAALRAGMSRRTLDALLAAGVLRQPLRGVLVDVRIPDRLALRAACVSLVLPEGAAVCRSTAAWLYGIDCRPPGRHLEIPAVDCVVPNVLNPIKRAGVRSYVATLPASDVVLLEGVRSTTAVRTAVDLARFLPRFMGLAAIDALVHAGLVVPADLATRVEDWKGDRFVDQARRLIALCEPRTESFGESWLRLRIVDAGFPIPEAQINLPDDDRPRWRLDLGYRKEQVGLEYDGEQFHSSEEQRAHDSRRREDCERSFGWRVYGFTKEVVLGPRMDLELAVGELLSMAPQISRRLW